MSPDIQRVLARLRVSEGWREHPYMDTTGHLTVGYGHNLGKLEPRVPGTKIVPGRPIPKHLGELLLLADVMDTLEELLRVFPWVNTLDAVRQEVLLDMAFNMGVANLKRKWPNFMRSVCDGEYEQAYATMRGSLWHKQVGQRAVVLEEAMRSGSFE